MIILLIGYFMFEVFVFDVIKLNSYEVVAFISWDTTAKNESSPPKEETEKKPIPNYEYTDLNATTATWNYFPNIPQQSVREPTIALDPVTCHNMTIDTSPPPKRTPTNNSCDGYAGVLHIRHGDVGGASGTIFFQFVVGFFQWADQHNYLPWVHYTNFSRVVHDKVVHGQGPATKFTMMDGMFVDWARDPNDPLGYKFPGRPEKRQDVKNVFPREFSVDDTGVWEHYFEPVSEFVPGDPSCRDKPIVSFDVLQVMPGLHSQTPWAPHAWQYWMPKHI